MCSINTFIKSIFVETRIHVHKYFWMSRFLMASFKRSSADVWAPLIFFLSHKWQFSFQKNLHSRIYTFLYSSQSILTLFHSCIISSSSSSQFNLGIIWYTELVAVIISLVSYSFSGLCSSGPENFIMSIRLLWS